MFISNRAHSNLLYWLNSADHRGFRGCSHARTCGRRHWYWFSEVGPRNHLYLYSTLRDSMLSPLYMSEMASPEVRGALVSLEQFSIVLGVVLGYWIGFYTRNIQGALSWRIPLGVQIIPGLILSFAILWLPPSPRLLIIRGKEDSAIEALERLRYTDLANPLLQLEVAEMKVEARIAAHHSSHKTNGWRSLLSPQLFSRTLLGVGIMAFQRKFTFFLYLRNK